MYLLTIEKNFSSAHQLNGYQGKCENLHGHNWKVELTVCGKELNDIGLLIDFHDLKDMLKEILSYLDHKNINDLKPFDVINPSSENIAKYIYEKSQYKLSSDFKDINVYEVTVWESDTSRCTFKK